MQYPHWATLTSWLTGIVLAGYFVRRHVSSLAGILLATKLACSKKPGYEVRIYKVLVNSILGYARKPFLPGLVVKWYDTALSMLGSRVRIPPSLQGDSSHGTLSDISHFFELCGSTLSSL